jgi:chromosome segregation ATPase
MLAAEVRNCISFITAKEAELEELVRQKVGAQELVSTVKVNLAAASSGALSLFRQKTKAALASDLSTHESTVDSLSKAIVALTKQVKQTQMDLVTSRRTMTTVDDELAEVERSIADIQDQLIVAKDSLKFVR